MARRKAPHIPDEVLDQLLSGTDAAAALREGGLLDGLKRKRGLGTLSGGLTLSWLL